MSDSSSSSPCGDWCPVFQPTMKEFSNFAAYVDTVIEPQARRIGICKIVPPKNWFERSYRQLSYTIESPVSQHIAGKKGVYSVDLMEHRKMDLVAFKEHAAEIGSRDMPNDNDDPDDIERKFWKNLRPTMNPPIYGADIVGSLFGDDPAKSWNLNKLDTILKPVDLPGITQAMLYFGMWKAMFAIHTEDMDLYSINYLHSGKAKFWYAIPPQYGEKLERAADMLFPEKRMHCHEFLRHKTTLLSPARLKEFNVPYVRVYQQPGEFVITFPAAYHMGFNCGFNIAEAVNFATFEWIPRGLRAKVCKCRPDNVYIDMDNLIGTVFDRYDEMKQTCKWKQPNSDVWFLSCICGTFITSEDKDCSVDGVWFACSLCSIWVHLDCVRPDLARRSKLPDYIYCHRCDKHVLERLQQSDGTNETPQLEVIGTKRKRTARGDTVFVTQEAGEPAEGRVVDMEGNLVRVHYKGYSSTVDDWIEQNSSRLIQKL